MRRRWRCFHCDEVFTRMEDAAQHFGRDLRSLTACQIKGHENLLIKKIREQEELLSSYMNEDGAILRAMQAQQAEHAQALIRAEELGYNRGVRDATLEHAASPEA